MNIIWINIFIIVRRKSDANMHVFLYSKIKRNTAGLSSFLEELLLNSLGSLLIPDILATLYCTRSGIQKNWNFHHLFFFFQTVDFKTFPIKLLLNFFTVIINLTITVISDFIQIYSLCPLHIRVQALLPQFSTRGPTHLQLRYQRLQISLLQVLVLNEWHKRLFRRFSHWTPFQRCVIDKFK